MYLLQWADCTKYMPRKRSFYPQVLSGRLRFSSSLELAILLFLDGWVYLSVLIIHMSVRTCKTTPCFQTYSRLWAIQASIISFGMQLKWHQPLMNGHRTGRAWSRGMISNNVVNNIGFARLNSTVLKKISDPAAGPRTPHYEMIFAVCYLLRKHQLVLISRTELLVRPSHTDPFQRQLFYHSYCSGYSYLS